MDTDALRQPRAPDLTIAGLANSLRVWALEQDFDVAITEAALLALFAGRAGRADIVEAIKATSGLVMTDLLDSIAANGVSDVSNQ